MTFFLAYAYFYYLICFFSPSASGSFHSVEPEIGGSWAFRSKIALFSVTDPVPLLLFENRPFPSITVSTLLRHTLKLWPALERHLSESWLSLSPVSFGRFNSCSRASACCHCSACRSLLRSLFNCLPFSAIRLRLHHWSGPVLKRTCDELHKHSTVRHTLQRRVRFIFIRTDLIVCWRTARHSPHPLFALSVTLRHTASNHSKPAALRSDCFKLHFDCASATHSQRSLLPLPVTLQLISVFHLLVRNCFCTRNANFRPAYCFALSRFVRKSFQCDVFQTYYVFSCTLLVAATTFRFCIKTHAFVAVFAFKARFANDYISLLIGLFNRAHLRDSSPVPLHFFTAYSLIRRQMNTQN